MRYTEKLDDTKQYKQNYLDGLEQIIQKRQKEAEVCRKEYTKDLFSKQEQYRSAFREMLGWPLAGHTQDVLPSAQFTFLSKEDGYTLYRVQLQVLEELTVTGLLLKQDGEEPKPLVITQHGGAGTPEYVTGVYQDTENYNDMAQRVVQRGVHVFAPQMLSWRDEFGVPFDRSAIDARLKRVGSSITAVEIYAITRILDYFEMQSYVSDFGMVGLSYGGFFTLFAAAADPRIRSALSSCFFNKRDAYPWCDWVWQNSAEKFDDAQIACLVYPRRLYLEIGDKDPVFDWHFGQESYEEICRICEEVGTQWVSFRVFDGVHELCREESFLEGMIQDLG